MFEPQMWLQTDKTTKTINKIYNNGRKNQNEIKRTKYEQIHDTAPWNTQMGFRIDLYWNCYYAFSLSPRASLNQDELLKMFYSISLQAFEANSLNTIQYLILFKIFQKNICQTITWIQMINFWWKLFLMNLMYQF